MVDWSRAHGRGEVLSRLERRRKRPSVKHQAEGKGAAAPFPPGSPLQSNTAPYPPAPGAALPGGFGGVKIGCSVALAGLLCLGAPGSTYQAFWSLHSLCGLCEEETAMVWHPTERSSSPFPSSPCTSDSSPSPQPACTCQSDASQALQ